ncbi:hypothetical protein [Shinella zoogloeoides]|uniref:hypothetical protein n=1 Tax=Shinella zoogloeoides TaxID=352475 RepID=UPI0028A5E6A8|nr:hypothetical protein [Shinella zoogloeoides]
MIKMTKMIVLAGLMLAMAGTAYAQESKRLPFPDGRYVSDKKICGMSEDKMVSEYGDYIGALVKIINGRKISNAYETSCNISKVKIVGKEVRILVICEGEGEEWKENYTYKAISKTSFSVDGDVFTLCKK